MLHENLCCFIALTYLSQFLLCYIQFHVADIAGFLSTGVDALHTGNTFFSYQFFFRISMEIAPEGQDLAHALHSIQRFTSVLERAELFHIFIRIVTWNLNIDIIKIYSIAKFAVQLYSEIRNDFQVCLVRSAHSNLAYDGVLYREGTGSDHFESATLNLVFNSKVRLRVRGIRM